MLELLVVVAVLAILLSLTMPALMKGHEQSRRAVCAERLRQFGIALHSYEAAFGRFPASWADSYFSGHTRLLPYLETDRPGLNFDSYVAPPDVAPSGIDVTKLKPTPTAFRCPSAGDQLDGLNYRLNTGPECVQWAADLRSGPFCRGVFRKASEITDGLGSTAFVSERLGGDGAQGFTPIRDLWMTAALYTPSFPTSDVYRRVCARAAPQPPHVSDLGGKWWIGDYRHTLYNHILPPNASIPDCGAAFEDPLVFDSMRAAVAARSFHPGGVHCLLGDGSVRFVADSIDERVWDALATRAGAEVEGRF